MNYSKETTVTARVSIEMKEKLRHCVDKEKMKSLNDVIETALEKYLESRQNRNVPDGGNNSC